MTSISKKVYINKLDDLVSEYNNTYHRTIKMKPVDVKDNTYIVSMVFRSKKFLDTKIFLACKGYTPNWPEEVFVIKKVKNTVPWTYVINDLNGDDIIGTFYEKELQKTNQQEFRIEKVIKKKDDKFYVIWKVYDTSFNSWFAKKT